MFSTVSSVRRPRRWERRSTRRRSVRSRRRTSSALRWVASWKVTLPSSPSEKTPSRTTTWKWKWGLRAEPKRCRKEAAPSWASPGADGLARRSVVRMPRSRTRSTSPARRGAWGRKGRIRCTLQLTAAALVLDQVRIVGGKDRHVHAARDVHADHVRRDGVVDRNDAADRNSRRDASPIHGRGHAAYSMVCAGAVLRSTSRNECAVPRGSRPRHRRPGRSSGAAPHPRLGRGNRRCCMHTSTEASRVALHPLQRDTLRTLRTLLLQNGTGHPSLAVELELEEKRSYGGLEARL
jgi:hypothetical protein